MLSRHCKECKKPYSLEEAAVDPNWKEWSTKPSCCYCPNCGSILHGISPDSVDLAKNLKWPQISVFSGALLACGLGVATGTLQYITPIILFAFGLWLRGSATRDHVLIGWLTMALSLIFIGVVLYAA